MQSTQKENAEHTREKNSSFAFQLSAYKDSSQAIAILQSGTVDFPLTEFANS
jgi:hypothetical protein